MDKKIKEIKNRIEQEKKDALEWHKNYLVDECGAPVNEVDTPEKIYQFMYGSDPMDGGEGMQFTSGFITGMQTILEILTHK